MKHWFAVAGLALLSACGRHQQLRLTATPPPFPATALANSSSAQQSSQRPVSSTRDLQKTETNDEPPRAPSEIAREYRAAAEPERRGELADSLWQIATPEALETLRQLYAIEREFDVKVDILSGVAEATRPELRDGCHALLLAALTPGQPAELRGLAAHYLTESRDPRSITLLQQFAQDADPRVREAAKEALEAKQENAAR